jgi:N-acetylmuramoyl-L-alanine amidase
MKITLIVLVSLLLSAVKISAEIKPLTRDEPLVRMVLQEANGEPFEGMVAVVGVALDRVIDRRWPDTIKEVVYQPWQFTGMRSKIGKYTNDQIELARFMVLIAKNNVRPCGRVLWYHRDDVEPSWAKRLEVACVIGRHIFYKDKR